MKGRKTGGRKKGTANKRTQVFGEVAAAVAQTIPNAFHGNAHALLMSIYKDPRYPVQVRMDARALVDKARSVRLLSGMTPVRLNRPRPPVEFQ